MKALIPRLLALVLIASVALPASAQQEPPRPQQPEATPQADTTRGMMPGGMMGMMPGGMMDMMQGTMMQGGMMQMHMQMMQQAMNDPLRRSALLVHALPTMQEPLGLSDEQATRLEETAQQLTEQQQSHREQMMQARQRLQDLLASDDAAPERVRSMLEEVATHHAQMQALAYETAMQMESVLTEERRTQLSEMAPMQLHQHMMMNMTMMEMMQAMHGGMMPGGMMQGGMMPGGMMQDGMMNRRQGGMMNRQ